MPGIFLSGDSMSLLSLNFLWKLTANLCASSLIFLSSSDDGVLSSRSTGLSRDKAKALSGFFATEIIAVLLMPALSNAFLQL